MDEIVAQRDRLGGRGIPGVLRDVKVAIQQTEHPDLFAALTELVGDLKGEQAAERVSSQIVRTDGIYSANFLDVARGKGLDRQLFKPGVNSRRKLNSIYRLFGAELLREGAEQEI